MRRLSKNPHGMVFLLAIVSLVTMLMLGVLLLRMSAQQFLYATKSAKDLHAMAMAEAGWNYLYWRQNWADDDTKGAIKPVTAYAEPAAGYSFNVLGSKDTGYTAIPLTLPGADESHADIWLFERKLPSESGYRIIARGAYRDAAGMVDVSYCPASTGVPSPPPIYDYAVYSNASFDTNGLYCQGNVGTNGNFSAKGKLTVDGNLNAAGAVTLSSNTSISGKAEYGTTYKTSGKSSVTFKNTGTAYQFPTIDLTYWKNEAAKYNAVINNSVSYNGGTQNFNAPVVYIKGDFSCHGNTVITGPVTIIVEGSITIAGTVQANPPLSGSTVNLALISKGGISLQGNATVYGFCYTHNDAGTATFSAGGNSSVYGAVLADVAQTSGSVSVYYDKSVASLPNPPNQGTTGAHPAYVVGWERRF